MYSLAGLGKTAGRKVKCDLVIHSAPMKIRGLPGGSDGKESACSAGDPGSIPGLGKSPGEGNGYPLQYSCLENPMDRGAWRATIHGVAKSRARLSTHTHCFSLASEEARVFLSAQDKQGQKRRALNPHTNTTAVWQRPGALRTVLRLWCPGTGRAVGARQQL